MHRDTYKLTHTHTHKLSFRNEADTLNTVNIKLLRLFIHTHTHRTSLPEKQRINLTLGTKQTKKYIWQKAVLKMRISFELINFRICQ